MTTKTTTSINVSRTIQASPAEVFRAWTEPSQLIRWSAPEGVAVEGTEVNLTVGGRYHIRMKSPEGTEYNVGGVYRVVEPPRRLQYTWQWEEEENDVGETLVTVEFIDLGNSSTEVRLTHDLFPNQEAGGGHSDGWNSALNRLEKIFS